jgi:hypothetical protein
MSTDQSDSPVQPGPSGPGDVWGADELDRVLADPGDAGRLGQVLAAASAPARARILAGEQAARSAFREAFPVVAPRSRILTGMSGRAAVVALIGGLVLTGGAAAAATGALPGPAQQTASDVLAKLGVSVPGGDDRTGGRAGQDTTGQLPVPTAEPSATPGEDEKPGHGAAVSDLARNTDATGVDHGAAVSELASGGKSQAGQHGKATHPSTDKAKTTPNPHATKRHNGDHEPKAGGGASKPKPHHTPTPHSAPGHS